MPDAPPSPLAQPATWDEIAGPYAANVRPFLARFAVDALDRIGVGATAASDLHAVDVASGPGTATFLLAPHVASVSAIDFAPEMIDTLKAAAAAQGVTNVEAQVGDGQQLPYPDDRFDLGVSMFGLMFFPDRPRGFAELARVLRPGGRVAVTAWAPVSRSKLMTTLAEILIPAFPELKDAVPTRPEGLADAAVFAAEMGAAGFVDVDIFEVERPFIALSAEAAWEAVETSFVTIPTFVAEQGERFVAERPGIIERLRERTGNGPVSLDSVAHVGVGRLP